jgi:hypothetical protein
MAEQFQTVMAGMVETQSVPPTALQEAGNDATPMHQPFRFVYNDDTPDRRTAGLPIHNWDMYVYIKSLKDVKSPDYTVEHTTGKFSYGYTLTLFIVEDNTGTLTTIATDAFIERLSAGVGWQRTAFNGPMTKADLQKYLSANSPDGTLHGLILQEYQQASSGTVPGGGATTSAAQAAGVGVPAPAAGTTTTPVDPNSPTAGTALPNVN